MRAAMALRAIGATCVVALIAFAAHAQEAPDAMVKRVTQDMQTTIKGDPLGPSSALRRAAARSATMTAKCRFDRGWGVASSARWTSVSPSRNQAPVPLESRRSMGSRPMISV